MESSSLPYPGPRRQPASAADGTGDPATETPKKQQEQERKGSAAGRLLEELGEMTVFSLEAISALPKALRYFSEAVRLNAVITRRSSLLVFVMCAFIGVSVANFGFFLLRSIGASDFVGVIPGLLAPRQLGPQMFGYVFAGSVGCAIAAELASARIQEEIDAYKAQGINPMELLIGSRILAMLLFVPLATALTLGGLFAGSYVTLVVILQGNTSQQFIDTFFSIFPMINIMYCAVAVLLLTLQCTLVACFYGMRNTGGGPDAVGGAVSRSLAVNIVLLHLVLAVFALITYAGGFGLPIGD